MAYKFRQAQAGDLSSIWEILQQAIVRRKADGSEQWQDGYPNPAVIQNDLEKDAGFVLTDGEKVIGYSAVMINDEPAYTDIIGKWLTNGNFIVVHRVAISDEYLGQGLAKMILNYIEEYAISRNIFSIKADTNFDNPAMMNIFKKMGYVYCGEVFFRGKPRKAYEKIISK